MIASRVSLFAAAALLASASVASAEPLRLSDAALDGVTAGIGVGQFWFSEASSSGTATLGLLGGTASTSSSTNSDSAVGGADASSNSTGSVAGPGPLSGIVLSRQSSCPSAPCADSSSLPPTQGGIGQQIVEGIAVGLGYSIDTNASTNSDVGFFFF